MRLLPALVLAALALPARAQPVTSGPDENIAAILAQSRAFSAAYGRGDIDTLVGIYAEDGVAAASGSDFVRGREALQSFWQIPEGRDITRHEATPIELHVDGDLAMDWGYYEGDLTQDGEALPTFRGKYLIVWRRGADGVWRMAHDMWNGLG